MKKINYFFLLLFVACVFGGCAVGSYVPHSVNLSGIQTTVVLDKANFRVVRNVEAVIEVDNDRLRRADVEKSAFAELTRKYPLTGSQAYINVVLDEVQREKVFAFHAGRYRLKQYVAIRATIIEFLQDNGQPIKSLNSPYNTVSQRTMKKEETEERKQLSLEEQRELSENLQESANKYYIAWLIRTGNVTEDKNKLTKLSKLYPTIEITKLAKEHTSEGLKMLSEGHDKDLEVFAK